MHARTRDGLDGQLLPPITDDDFTRAVSIPVDFSRVSPLTGPVFIKGARPGDVLSVKILDMVPKGVGTLVVWPADARYDFLEETFRDSFPEGHLKHFDFGDPANTQGITLRPGVYVPLMPMLGMIGTAPAEGVFKTGPPREFGGNMDVKHLGKGATVHLPVFVEGGLVSIGDGHAVQGDGELCTTAVETAMEVALEFKLHKNTRIEEPHIETEELYIFTSFGRSLEEASNKAMRYCIEWLAHHYGFTMHEAYMLLGLAGNLCVSQVVNSPHLGARVELAKKVFNPAIW